jgi:hypothetical protein
MPLTELLLILSPFLILSGINAVTYYWVKKTRRYLLPATFGVVFHISIIPALIMFLAVSEGDSTAQVVDDLGLAFIIVAFCVVALVGLVSSLFVVLYESGRHKMALVLLVVVFVIPVTPILDEINFDPVLYVESVLQGEETEYQGNKIYLGNSYLYSRSWESLGISKILPGYSGVEENYYLAISSGWAEKVDELNRTCQDEINNCKWNDRGGYQTVSLTDHSSFNDHKWSSVYYYNQMCSSYLRSFSDIQEKKYTGFVGRFFSDNC